MKLLYCPQCGDLVALRAKNRTCACGHASGQYLGRTKAVVRGKDVQVLALANDRFDTLMKQAVRATPTTSGDDYRLPENELTAWIFGPNALAVTRDSVETDRDRKEIAAAQTITFSDTVDYMAKYLNAWPRAERERFTDALREELRRLAPLAAPSRRRRRKHTKR